MNYLILFLLCIVQNAAFTAVSRSRNSADVLYHGWTAIWSNTIWFAVTVLLWNNLWKDLTTGSTGKVALTGAVYVAGAVLGSMAMMKWALKFEKGKRKVGATVEKEKPTSAREQLCKALIAFYDTNSGDPSVIEIGDDIIRAMLVEPPFFAGVIYDGLESAIHDKGLPGARDFLESTTLIGLKVRCTCQLSGVKIL